MKLILLIPIVLVIIIGTGCGPRQLYNGLRFGQEIDCQRLQRSDQDECFKRAGMSYDEYQRQLKEREKEK
jgi:hypothetical protein